MTKWILEFSWRHSLENGPFVTFGIARALLLAGFTWWLCGFSMWLWNRQFRLKFINHLFCAVAAVVTLLTICAYQCAGAFPQLAREAVQAWQNSYEKDTAYHHATFVQAYDALQQLYRERSWKWDYGQFRDPRDAHNPGNLLPSDVDGEVSELTMKIYRDRAVAYLGSREPVLSAILWKGAQLDLKPLKDDLREFVRSHPDTQYGVQSGTVRITALLAVDRLTNEIDHFNRLLRWKLLAIFFCAQLIAFSLAAHSAYSDLRIRST